MSNGSVQLTIDGLPVTVPIGTSIFDAARMNGIAIPTLCHQQNEVPVGVCRLCIVDTGGRVFAASCVAPAADKMVVTTGSERVKKARRTLIELLMADHPTPCARHDCELETMARLEGIGQPRFAKRLSPRGHDNSSLVISVDHEACILCDRCIRGCDEVRDNNVLGRRGKGFNAGVAFDNNLPMGNSSCISCGECMISCPTGALTNNVQHAELRGEPVEVEQLLTLPCFQKVSGTFLELNKHSVVVRHFQKGDIICREGDYGSTAFYILEGKVETFLNSPIEHVKTVGGATGFLSKLTSFLATGSEDRRLGEDERRTIPIDGPVDLPYNNPVATLGPGDLFGEMACMSLYPYSATVRASTDCVMLEMLRNVLDMTLRGQFWQLDWAGRRGSGRRGISGHLPAFSMASSENAEIPPGLRLRHTFRVFESRQYYLEKLGEPDPNDLDSRVRLTRAELDYVIRVAWAPDQRTLAALSRRSSIVFCDLDAERETERLHSHPVGDCICMVWAPNNVLLTGHSASWSVMGPILTASRRGKSGWNFWYKDPRGWGSGVLCLALSPDGLLLAAGTTGSEVKILGTETRDVLWNLRGHQKDVQCVAWSPDGETLASGSEDGTLRFWEGRNGRRLRKLKGHQKPVNSVIWSPDGRILASSSGDHTIRLWDAIAGREIRVLEGHTGSVATLSFEASGAILVSTASDNSVVFWRCSDGQELGRLRSEHQLNYPQYSSDYEKGRFGLAFHPTKPVLATLDDEDTVIRIWDVDLPVLLSSAAAFPSAHYCNAKVVLLGDSGVGKSGLSLVLSGQPFAPTESTHGRKVWRVSNDEVRINDHRETREILLWDLGGQPGYRLVNQLSLKEVVLALIVFDSRSETDPFAGVRYWDRALRQARLAEGRSDLPLKKFLVAARIDVGRHRSESRMDAEGENEPRVRRILRD